ncbi:MAG: D-sedoheptulose 7-phosphate isomerase [Candidatus Omnitrophota bacterium]
MDSIIEKYSAESIKTKSEFFADKGNRQAIKDASLAMIGCFNNGGKVLVFGNGGSAADSQHLAAELVVRFEKERKALPAVALTTDTSILTASGNDYDFSRIFSRQVEALANKNDIAFAISTSGNSKNVIEGVRTAKEKKALVIALTGKDGGVLGKEADIAITVRSNNTARVQEVHVAVIHIICKIVEESLST